MSPTSRAEMMRVWPPSNWVGPRHGARHPPTPGMAGRETMGQLALVLPLWEGPG